MTSNSISIIDLNLSPSIRDLLDEEELNILDYDEVNEDHFDLKHEIVKDSSIGSIPSSPVVLSSEPLHTSDVDSDDSEGDIKDQPDSTIQNVNNLESSHQSYEDPELDVFSAPTPERTSSPELRHRNRKYRNNICKVRFSEESEEIPQRGILINANDNQDSLAYECEGNDITGTNHSSSRDLKRKFETKGQARSNPKLGRNVPKNRNARNSYKSSRKENSNVGHTSTDSNETLLGDDNKPDLTIPIHQETQDAKRIHRNEDTIQPDSQTRLDASDNTTNCDDRNTIWSHNRTNTDNGFNAFLNSFDGHQGMSTYSPAVLYPSIDNNFMRSWASAPLSQFSQRLLFPSYTSVPGVPPIDFLLQFAAWENEVLSRKVFKEQQAHIRTQEQMQQVIEERDELNLHLRDLENQYTRLSQRFVMAEQRSNVLNGFQEY
ncbi:hypothetical protein BGZ49_009248 [Haplosporangium sp. Z 27]|nr:hypothetical protein BGZ49_009248 [Haplosporangium sp. Z 27]